jgi:hypothetical protein
MRAVVLLTSLALSSSFNVVELSDFIDAHWRAQTEGDAVAFVSHLAPGFSQVINGEVDNTAWTDVTYVQDLFQKVTFSSVNSLSSVAVAGANTVIVVIDWEVQFVNTLETLNMGEWQQTFTFNDDGKLIKLSSICDGAYVQKYSDLVSTQVIDYRPSFEALVNAFNTKNVNGVLSAFVPEELYWRRNGQNDSFTWIRPRFLGFLFQQSLTLTLDSFASSVPRTSYAAMTWTHTAQRDHKVSSIPDSWFVTWNPDGKISHVRSITNGQEAILYAHLIRSVTETLSPQSKEDLRKMYESGSFNANRLRQHLDL